MHFTRVICAVLVFVCSGNAVVDPVQPVLSEKSTLAFETTTPSITTPSITPTETTTPAAITETTTPAATTETTTPAATTETTTPAATTETTTSTTTTPKPNPPHPTGMNWVVVDETTNITCIVVKLSATVVIPYQTINGNVENATIVVPSNATSNGTCNLGFMDDQTNQKISLQWTFGQNVFPNILTLLFHKNMSSGNDSSVKEHVSLSEIVLQVYLDSANFPNATREFIYADHLDSTLHSVPVNNSYRCNSHESVELDVQESTFPATLHMTHLQMEAFRTSTNDKFSSAVDCPADKVITSDIVPIAVGCALAALVVIVLVAYLIGRRRARQRGYQSV